MVSWEEAQRIQKLICCNKNNPRRGCGQQKCNGLKRDFAGGYPVQTVKPNPSSKTT